MKNFEKESLFWYGLHIIAKNNAELKYYIVTQKDLISSLYPLTYFGVIQYTLYRGIKISEIPLEETKEYAEYIIENIEKLHKVRYRFVKEKPKKLVIKDEETENLVYELISGLLLPYINNYCFRKPKDLIKISKAYVREALFNYEYDINHESDDGKLKTSALYPFLFTLNLIKNGEKQGLFQRVHKYYQRDNLIRKYKSGRDWKPKEVEYLQETIELIENDEEWSLFLSNFTASKWDDFDMKERFKALFQLTKVTTILMKDEITAVTMLSDGGEVFEMLENYLPYFLYLDKIQADNKILDDYTSESKAVLSPFSHQHMNYKILKTYIRSKGTRHIQVDFNKLVTIHEIVWYVFSEIRTMLLVHEYLPKVIDNHVQQKRKLYVEILELFTEVKENKFKERISFENMNEGTFFMSEDELIEASQIEFDNSKQLQENVLLHKLGKVLTFLLSIEPETARSFDYNLEELIKYVIILFGPHPLGHTVQTTTLIENIFANFKKLCLNYEGEKSKSDDLTLKFQSSLELPLKLLNWKKD